MLALAALLLTVTQPARAPTKRRAAKTLMKTGKAKETEKTKTEATKTEATKMEATKTIMMGQAKMASIVKMTKMTL